jgi:iron complex transport system permease protein
MAEQARLRRVIAVLSSLLIAFFLGALVMGRFHVPFKEVVRILAVRIFPLRPTWTDQMENVVMNIRLPRVCGAVLVGWALAASGAAYQGMFRNLLISPDLLGVSAGACVGAAAAILLHLGSWYVQVFALAGGLLAVAVTVVIPNLFKNGSSLMLVLAGVIVSGFMNAILGILKYAADPESELASIIYWTMGSLSSVRLSDIAAVSSGVLIPLLILLLLRWRVNLLALGDQEAYSLGVNTKALRFGIVLCATVITASAICLSGTVGWVGLIIPHLGRLLVGQDNRKLMPVSVLLGGIFMLFVDTVARNLTGSEIPLSILTGLIGAPLFIWLLLWQKSRIE